MDKHHVLDESAEVFNQQVVELWQHMKITKGMYICIWSAIKPSFKKSLVRIYSRAVWLTFIYLDAWTTAEITFQSMTSHYSVGNNGNGDKFETGDAIIFKREARDERRRECT